MTLRPSPILHAQTFVCDPRWLPMSWFVEYFSGVKKEVNRLLQHVILSGHRRSKKSQSQSEALSPTGEYGRMLCSGSSQCKITCCYLTVVSDQLVHALSQSLPAKTPPPLLLTCYPPEPVECPFAHLRGSIAGHSSDQMLPVRVGNLACRCTHLLSDSPSPRERSSFCYPFTTSKGST